MAEFTRVCALSDLESRSAKRVAVGGETMAIVRTDDGVFAVQDRCSHADVSLAEGEVDGHTIECWLHGSAFDVRNGWPLSLPAVEPIATYQTRVVGEGAGAAVEVNPFPVRLHGAGPAAFN